MTKDEFYMKRCLMLAELGKQAVRSNPMVGCLIVHNDSIIGEGYHTKYGNPHAEVEAVNSVKDKNLLKNSILYVNLEPCSHFGKTPPCTSLIIENKIPKVVIATLDPNPIVKGEGVQTLIKHGVQVKTTICETETKMLNKRFFTFYKKKRPYIILKWAQTKDGFIDIVRKNDTPQINWISNKYSKQLVHKWRAEELGILIGTNTALMDNPELTTRKWKGDNPSRFLIDKNLIVPHTYNIFNSDAPSYVYYNQEIKIKNPLSDNIHYVPLDFSRDIIPQIYSHLYSINIISLIVEGGKATLDKFINSNTWDEARVIEGNKWFQNGLSAPTLPITAHKSQEVIDDNINYYFNKSAI